MENPQSVGGQLNDLFEDLKDSIFGNERLSDLMQFAEHNGFGFKKRIPFSNLDYELKAFELFKGKSRKKIRNILQRDSQALQATLYLFDYTSQSEFRKTNTTCLLVESRLFQLPEFLIRPKRTTEKLTRLFAAKDIFTEQYPVFSKNFTLVGIEKEQILYFVTKSFVDLMLQIPHLHVEGHKKYLLLYEKNKMKAPEDLLPFYDFGLELSHVLLFDKSNEFV